MTTPALRLAADFKQMKEPERLAWGPVELQVTDLGRARWFWQEVLGLVPRAEFASGAIELGTTSRPIVILHPGARQPVQNGYAGLYHLAIGVPDQAEFSRYLARFMAMKLRFAPVDHTMSKAIYLNDPDGHGVEIAFETPERFSHFVGQSQSIAMVDTEGRLRSGRDPLDIDEELSHASTAGLLEPISKDACVAHLHLHVPALGEAIRFFETIGFTRNLVLPGMGLVDFGAGGAYTHRLAVNIWQGGRVKPAPEGSARLMGYTILTRSSEMLADVGAKLGLARQTGAVRALEVCGVDMTIDLAGPA
jgi:catechol 2,3-dioxygenase